ncbi:MAG: hypothetical protein DRP93_07435, partial [Candidatus Neomarinimicrobiota bacterium]
DNDLDTAVVNHRYKHSQDWLYNEIIPIITDKNLTVKKRMSKIRTFRNYNFTPGIKTLLEIAEDTTDNVAIRKGAIEALGWFVMNPNYKELITELQGLTQSDVPEVKAEAIKTIKRLEAGANLVITP